jgi:hypothetical protein
MKLLVLIKSCQVKKPSTSGRINSKYGLLPSTAFVFLASSSFSGLDPHIIRMGREDED